MQTILHSCEQPLLTLNWQINTMYMKYLSLLSSKVKKRESETRLQFQGQAINFDYEGLASREKFQSSVRHMA